MRIATYNILADAYIRPEYYPKCDPLDFTAAVRHPKLEAYVPALDADVLLLQEVEHAAFKRLDAKLRPAGYLGRWAHKWAGKPDGCATFVRAPLWVSSWLTIDLDGGPDRKAGHIALIAVIAEKGRMWTLVNTHLKWDPPDTKPAQRAGLAQAKHLLAVLANTSCTVIAGDFNAEPEDAVLYAFREAGFVDAHLATAATFVMEARPRKIDYLLHTLDLRAFPLPTAALTPLSALPSKDEPSDHLPLLADITPA